MCNLHLFLLCGSLTTAQNLQTTFPSLKKSLTPIGSCRELHITSHISEDSTRADVGNGLRAKPIEVLAQDLWGKSPLALFQHSFPPIMVLKRKTVSKLASSMEVAKANIAAAFKGRLIGSWGEIYRAFLYVPYNCCFCLFVLFIYVYIYREREREIDQFV